MENKDKYSLRGVSARKEEVHRAIEHLSKGVYPLAFCKILPDLVGGDPAFANIMHADTAGTKTALAYLYWKETGNLEVWKGVAQDAIVMNLDDMACVGCVDGIVISSTIGRNKNLIPGEVVAAVIAGTSEFLENLEQLGVGVHLAGGETADVGDIVRTIDVGITAFARTRREDLIINDVQHGDVVVGLASYGQSTYESAYNSGIGSNGLTSARHDVLNDHYRTNFPESFDPNTPAEVVYIGKHRLTDEVVMDGHTYETGQLVLSPTRTFLPVIKRLIDTLGTKPVNGLIHCTGGGQTKVLKFIRNKRVIKDQLLPIPPVFRMIQSETNTGWQEMFQVFNMGHRLEVYLPEEYATQVVAIAKEFGIDAGIIGRVEDHVRNEVVVETGAGTFTYQ